MKPMVIGGRIPFNGLAVLTIRRWSRRERRLALFARIDALSSTHGIANQVKIQIFAADPEPRESIPSQFARSHLF